MASLRSHSGDVYVALDTSGSVSEADLSGFWPNSTPSKPLAKCASLFACDLQPVPDAPWVYEVGTFRRHDNIDGGGGTSFTPVFDWIGKSGRKPDSLVYFTDAVGAFQSMLPDTPVMWLVKAKPPCLWAHSVERLKNKIKNMADTNRTKVSDGLSPDDELKLNVLCWRATCWPCALMSARALYALPKKAKPV
ncbi:MAG: hypothetical protein IPH40_03950 [Polaromonas sp.]|nr:hypothetical protein [Polaromonas sp.]